MTHQSSIIFLARRPCLTYSLPSCSSRGARPYTHVPRSPLLLCFTSPYHLGISSWFTIFIYLFICLLTVCVYPFCFPSCIILHPVFCSTYPYTTSKYLLGSLFYLLSYVFICFLVAYIHSSPLLASLLCFMSPCCPEILYPYSSLLYLLCLGLSSCYLHIPVFGSRLPAFLHF